MARPAIVATNVDGEITEFNEVRAVGTIAAARPARCAPAGLGG
jgi:hypothetical protein